MKKILRITQPFLIAIAPLIVLFRNNPGEIFLFDFLLIAVLLIIVIALLSLLISRLRKDGEKTSISLSLLCFALILSAEFSSISKSLIWSLCTLSALFSLIFPIPSKWKTVFSYYLSIPFLAIISYNVFEIGYVKKTILAEMAQLKSASLPSKHSCSTCSRDIYLIILDEFISERSFKDYYHFDNFEFFDHLRNKGFHIVRAIA